MRVEPQASMNQRYLLCKEYLFVGHLARVFTRDFYLGFVLTLLK